MPPDDAEPAPRPLTVAVATDSTAYLPADVVSRFRHRGGAAVRRARRTVGAGGQRRPARPRSRGRWPTAGARSRRRGRLRGTSSPSTGALLDGGADRVVSVHLSGELSGTWDAARVAAGQVGEHLVTVAGLPLRGHGHRLRRARGGARRGRRQRSAEEVAAAARETAAATRTFFVVDTLEHLRRGGRIGGAAALLGSALAVKPVLHVADGQVVPLERVRTFARALEPAGAARGRRRRRPARVRAAVHHRRRRSGPSASPSQLTRAAAGVARRASTSVSSGPPWARTSARGPSVWWSTRRPPGTARRSRSRTEQRRVGMTSP